MNIVKNLVDKSKYSIKCPYSMLATRIVIHETSNDASAKNEISYMINNNNEVSYHFAIDDKEIVQGIPIDRSTWNAGDGVNGKGNREGISIEICYSKSGGERWQKSVENAAKFTAQLLMERNWGIDKVTKHQDYSGKYCPHRILEKYGWDNFLNLIKSFMISKWIKDDVGWWYRHADGTYTTNGWEKIGNEWFYFDANGYAAKANSWLKINNRWYYFNERNAAVKGYQTINGKLYYFVETANNGLDECQLLMTNTNGEILITI